MIQLRDYQTRFVEDLRGAFRAGHRRVLGVAPTGSGKTACAASMVAGAVAIGNRVLFAAGRRELIRQTVGALGAAGLTDVRVIQGSEDTGRSDAPVIVGSVQTLSTPRWLREPPLVQFGILDEAHHGSAATWSDLVKSQPDARWVGLTATPERADGKPLGDLFDTLVCGPTVAELTMRGFLVPCRIWAGPATLKSGELALKPLEAYQRFAGGQRAGVFCRDVRHATAELAAFQTAGIPSALITARTPDLTRDAALAAWRSGTLLVVTSVNVLTEGFDLPVLGTAIVARRFNHAGQYLQAAGRILRAAPDKTHAQLIDLTGCAHEHGPIELEREYSLTGHAIARSTHDSFGQCRACGSMFLYGPRQCPHCGEEIPTRPLALPRSTGVDVDELKPPAPRQPWVVGLAAKFPGNCAKCGRWFPRGTLIYATAGKRNSARHQRCPLPAIGAPA